MTSSLITKPQSYHRGFFDDFKLKQKKTWKVVEIRILQERIINLQAFVLINETAIKKNN